MVRPAPGRGDVFHDGHGREQEEEQRMRFEDLQQRDRRLQGADRPMRTSAVSRTVQWCLRVRGQATKP